MTGLKVVALELFEQDMVGVKGYDAAILEALKRHNVWIVSKTSNANTITHYVHASLKSVRRVAKDLEALTRRPKSRRARCRWSRPSGAT